jgi:imidazole glycerol-phosphate synthase subunit HisH
MQRLVIVNYGSGNLHSAAKAFERAARESEANIAIAVSADPGDALAADRVVLPGVGAFAECRRGIEALPGMRAALEESVRKKGRPFLGICVGAQLMAERGLEFYATPGFGWVKGAVTAIVPNAPKYKIPHMGWNTLRVINDHPLLAGIATGPGGLHAYFVHSFHLAGGAREDLVAETDHGGPVTAMVAKDNMAGTQFHPEKSQRLGLRLIANFLKWRP